MVLLNIVSAAGIYADFDRKIFIVGASVCSDRLIVWGMVSIISSIFICGLSWGFVRLVQSPFAVNDPPTAALIARDYMLFVFAMFVFTFGTLLFTA